jgi:hypothetical protein
MLLAAKNLFDLQHCRKKRKEEGESIRDSVREKRKREN